MAKFAVGQSLTTTEPTIAVDGGLPIGAHRFQLVVVNGRGVKSAPDEAVVQVQRTLVLPPIGISPIQPLPIRPL